MGHRDYKTTEVYADFAPDSSQGAKFAELAFGLSSAVGIEETKRDSVSMDGRVLTEEGPKVGVAELSP
jgi:hypothetical protein